MTTANDVSSAVKLAAEEVEEMFSEMVAIDAGVIAMFYQRLLRHNIPDPVAKALAVAYLGRMHIYGGGE